MAVNYQTRVVPVTTRAAVVTSNAKGEIVTAQKSVVRSPGGGN